MGEQYINTTTHGTKYYYKDKAKTILHRLDGPAIEWPEGNKAWFVNGKRHRLDGPAYEHLTGVNSWYVNDIFIMAVDKEGKVVKRMK